MSLLGYKYFLFRTIRWAMFHSSNAKMAWAESTRQESNYLRFPHLAVATWLEIPVLLAPTGTTRYQLFPTKEHCRTGLILMKIYKKKKNFDIFKNGKKILANQRSKIRILLNNNNILKISVFSKCYGVKILQNCTKHFSWCSERISLPIFIEQNTSNTGKHQKYHSMHSILPTCENKHSKILKCRFYQIPPQNLIFGLSKRMSAKNQAFQFFTYFKSNFIHKVFRNL